MEDNYTGEGFAIVTARVIDDEELTPTAKLFYIRITMLSMERGYCFASNDYLAGKLKVHHTHITKLLKQLIERNYIVVRFKERPGMFSERRIYPVLLQNTIMKKLLFATGFDTFSDAVNAQAEDVLSLQAEEGQSPQAEPLLSPQAEDNSISNTNNISIEVVMSESDTETPDPTPTKKPKSFEEKFTAFIALFNKLTGRNFKGCDKSKRNFKARLKAGYTAKEFTAAITAAYNSEHHRDNNHTYLTPEFITRSDKLEMYLASSNKNGDADTRGTAAAGQKLSYNIANKLNKQTAQR